MQQPARDNVKIYIYLKYEKRKVIILIYIIIEAWTQQSACSHALRRFRSPHNKHVKDQPSNVVTSITVGLWRDHEQLGIAAMSPANVARGSAD